MVWREIDTSIGTWQEPSMSVWKETISAYPPLYTQIKIKQYFYRVCNLPKEKQAVIRWIDKLTKCNCKISNMWSYIVATVATIILGFNYFAEVVIYKIIEHSS